jgi:hypothetical protein
MLVDNGLSEPRIFAGTLSGDGNELCLDVRIHVDSTGEVLFGFDPIPLTDDSQFLLMDWSKESDRPTKLGFAGVAEDKTRFQTDDLHSDKCSHRWDASGDWVDIAGRCLHGTFHRPLAEAAPQPVLVVHVRGFQNFGGLEADCDLGTVTMAAHPSNGDRNAITGSLQIRAVTAPDDPTRWREEAERLLEHIRRVMSIAAASLLRSPIIEFFAGDVNEVTALSQIAQGQAGLRTIRAYRQEAIFNAAVKSFFDPPTDAKQLFFAIEWFAMEVTYKEMRLVCAMTALENLIEANIVDTERFIEESGVFEKTRRALRAVIRKCLAKWSPGRADDVLKELNEKLADLNRRSLMRKVEILATRWKVPLNGIPREKLRAALNARNLVVHQGQYYESKQPEDEDLWVHVTIIREVVARFLFTIIGYRGDYCSYVGRPHDGRFPP